MLGASRESQQNTRMRTLALLTLALMSSSCATTHVLDLWKAEGAAPLKRAGKRAVVVATLNPERRDAAEAKLAELVNGVVLRSLFTPEELHDRELVKARLLEQGFQDVVVMRLMNVDEQVSRVRGPIWTNWDLVDLPRVTSTRVDLLTSIYDLAEGQLVYQLNSHTHDPANIDAFLEEQVRVGVQRLRDDGALVD